MSDVLDLQSQCCSEFEDDQDGFTAVKGGIKSRRGRGFAEISGGELMKLKGFDSVKSNHPSKERLAPQGSVEGWVIFVTGIHEEATEDDVKDLFSEHGNISNLVLNLDRRTGYIKGYALIEFEKYQHAFFARELLNGSLLLDQPLKVNWAFIKQPHLEKRRNIKML